MRLAFLLSLVLAASAQVPSDANTAYRTPEGRASLAGALDSPDRDSRERPRDLVAVLGLKPGDTVVDFGTGPGYMLPYLSHAVAPSGKVIAEDIQTDFLDKARAKAQREHLGNISFILGSESDPRLPQEA